MATVPIDPTTNYSEPTSTRTTSQHSTNAHTTSPQTGLDSIDAALGASWQPGGNWSPSQDSTGFTQPVSQGYDAQATQLNATRKAKAIARASGYLLNGSSVNGNKAPGMPLFITAINIDTSLGGSTAQSQFVQDFYPRNFVQPVVNVYGISLDQEDYGTMCEFVHQCQYDALNTAASWAQSMTQLIVLGANGIDGETSYLQDPINAPADTARNAAVGGRTQGRQVVSTFSDTSSSGVTTPRKQLHVNQTIRGDHDTLIAKGYINSMPRIHQQFQYATVWQFDFTVAQMLQGPFRENAAVPTNMAGGGMWSAMVAAGTYTNSQVTSKQNKASLAYAASKNASLVASAS